MLLQVSQVYLWGFYVLTCLGQISFSRIPLRATQQFFCSFCQNFSNSRGVQIHSSPWCEAAAPFFAPPSVSMIPSKAKWQKARAPPQDMTACGCRHLHGCHHLCSLCVCLSFWAATSGPSNTGCKDNRTWSAIQWVQCQTQICKYVCVHTHYIYACNYSSSFVSLPRVRHILLILNLYYVNIQFIYPFTSWKAFSCFQFGTMKKVLMNGHMQIFVWIY